MTFDSFNDLDLNFDSDLCAIRDMNDEHINLVKFSSPLQYLLTLFVARARILRKKNNQMRYDMFPLHYEKYHERI